MVNSPGDKQLYIFIHQTSDLQNIWGKHWQKGEIDSNIILVGGFNTLPSIMDRTTRQKISKEIEDLNTLDKLDPSDIQRTLHRTTAEYTFFSRAHGTFSKTDHIRSQDKY